MKLLYLIIFFPILTGLMLFKIWQQWPDDKLRFIQCDVGQGDAVIITKGFVQILVDSGPDDTVLSCLSKYLPFWDKHINLIIATHADKDHIGGLLKVLSIYDSDLFINNDFTGKDQKWSQIYSLLQSKQTKITSANDFNQINIDEISINFLWPKSKIEIIGDDNADSVVAKIKFKQFEALLTGDIPNSVEENLVNAPNSVKSLVLKLSHHGSKYSDSTNFYKAVAPQIATIGVGKNKYGHPDKMVLQDLQNLGVKVIRTDEGGDIMIVSNGEDYQVIRSR